MPSTGSAFYTNEAIALAEEREDVVRDATALFNKDVAYFVENFVLPQDPAHWAQEYGVQLSAQHAAYLQQVREELRLQSHNLRMFHTRPRPDHPTGEDPYKIGDLSNLNAMLKLVTLVVAAAQHKKQMFRLYSEFVLIRSKLEETDSLTLPDRIFIKKSLPGIVSIMTILNVQTKTLQVKLNAFKQPFYLLADQDEVSDCVTRLLNGQITANIFADAATQPFAELFRLAQERETIVKDAENIAISQALAWLGLPNGRVPVDVYDREVERYDPLLDAIKKQKVVHDRCVEDLMTLHERANGWPQAVVGPDGHLISLEVIRSTMKEYEWIAETSYQIIEAALPINKTLESFNTELCKLL